MDLCRMLLAFAQLLVLQQLLLVQQLVASYRPLPNWFPAEGEFVRLSLADRVFRVPAFAPSFAPSPQPTLPAETSTISPSGYVLQGPLQPPQARERHHIQKGILASIILVPTIVCGLIIFCSYVSLDSLRAKVKSAFAHQGDDDDDDDDDGFAPAPPGPAHQENGQKHPGRHNNSNSEAKSKPAQAMDYDLLEKATNGFSNDCVIGEGGFAKVYKAQVDENHVLAVKKLSTENELVDQEFMAEIELMAKIQHANLVSLVGYSSKSEERLLVYELMINGSLQDQLQGPAQGAALTWHLRLKIALDAARGLEYLHDQCKPPVIHRDFKSSNILLDASFNAKLSDFGLALAVENGSQKAGSLQLQGTFGYVAPEYILTGILTEKSDVYAFGVVLLELITGRKPIDMTMPTGCQSLVTWATPQLTDRTRLPQIVDAAIKDTVNLKQLFQVAAIAVLCVQSEPSYRPLIGDVVNSLVPLVPCNMGGALRDPL